MADVAYIGGGSITVNSGSTSYSLLNSDITPRESSSSAGMQVLCRTAGTLSRLKVYVQTNTLNDSTTVSTYATTTLTVSIGAGATGAFTDTTHTLAIAAGDTCGYLIDTTASASGSIVIRYINSVFSASSNTSARHVCHLYSASADTISGVSKTFYFPLSGYALGGKNVSKAEAFMKCNMNSAGTLKNLIGYLTARSGTKSVTLTSRKGGAAGNQTCTLSGLGSTEDTVNTDSISADNDVNFLISTPADYGTDTASVTYIAYDFETTNSTWNVIAANYSGVTQNANTSYYYTLGGNISADSTEANVKTTLGVDGTCRATNLYIMLSANSVSATSTFRLRQNGANTSLSASITASTTGKFEDTTNTVTLANTDDLNYLLTTGASRFAV